MNGTMGCCERFSNWIKDVSSNAKAWNVTTTILAGGCLIAGTVVMVQTCTVPDNNTPSYECAGQTTELISNELIFALLISMAAFILIFLYEILVAIGMTCDSCCRNERHTVFIALLAAISATVYADYAMQEMDRVPRTAISNPDACFVCPDGDSPTAKGLFYTAIVITWLGVATCMYVVCLMTRKSAEKKKFEGLKMELTKDGEEV